jgi:hypothetical protein
MNKQFIAVSNNDLVHNNQQINRDLLIYNQFHKNANLPYLESVKNNSKKDNRNQQINMHQFILPQKAMLGINPILNQQHNLKETQNNNVLSQNNTFTENLNSDNLPLNIYRNFSSGTRVSKKSYSNYDMNQRNQYK